jgi:flagellin-like hook-associated protein FlgL
LEATQSNLWTQLVDLRSAESVLRDTDFAGTISNLVAEQVRQDVATAVLGLANQSVGAVIDLLQQSTPAPLNAAKPSKLKHS